jgi:hypothetical protein
MQKLKMISGMLLISFLTLGNNSCQTKQNIDVGIFSRDYQKFYFSNQATGKKFEIQSTDPRADKLVCVPYRQYIDLQKNYTCQRKTK